MQVKRQLFALLFVLGFFSILASSSNLLYAQSAPDGWYYNKTIRGITFQGLKAVKSSDLEGITGSFVGREFNDTIYEDMINRIFALNYFEDITDIKMTPIGGDYTSCKTIAITLTVKEYPVVSKITYKGIGQLHLSDIKNVIKLKEKEVYNDNQRLMDERAIRDLYIEKGFTDVKVSSKSEDTDSGIEVVFTISEGRATVVRSIVFTGNKAVSASTLKGKISLKEVRLFNKGAFQEAMLEQDAKAIEAYYKDRGYVDARVIDKTVDSNYNESKQRNELTITFNIQEGSSYTFGGVTFEGNNVFSDEELQALVKVKVGKDYNETSWQETLMAIVTKYRENGYQRNGFEPVMDKDSDEKVISYTLHIMEQERSHVEEIIIKGNAKTKDEVILREVPLESGDVYSYSKVMNGLRNLYNLQYFSQVYPELAQGSEENLMNIILNVEEQSTTTVNFGFTFSGVSDPSEFPVSFYVNFVDSNLFGEGKTASAGLTLSTDKISANLGYTQNWIFDLPITNAFSIGYTYSKETDIRNYIGFDGVMDDDSYYIQYVKHEFNLTEALSRRWTPDFAILTLTGGISGSLINNIYDGTVYIPNDSSLDDYNNNWEPLNYVFSSFSMDGRNINYDPSSGWFFSQRVSWYGLLPRGIFSPTWGETEFYLRTDTKGELYFTLLDKPITEKWNLKFVLMAYSGLSFQFPIPGTSIKQGNQLYIDGMFYGRGWTIYNTAAGRGKALWNNTVELRMPVVPGFIALDAFFDASMIKNSASEMFSDFGNLDDWYFSYGPSLRFTIQQFPLRLLFVSQFQVDNGQIAWKTAKNATTDWLGSWHFVLSFNITNK